jgi:uncharacterized membrane protein HdeD (DUF308 family)
MKSFAWPQRFKKTTQPNVQERTESPPWWAVLLAGIVIAAIGVLLIVIPGATATILFWILGIACIIGGIVLIASIWTYRASWAWRLLAGIAAILIGLAIISQPLFSAYLFAAILLWILGAAVIVGGIGLILWAFSYAGWVPGILGVLCMILGGMLVLASAVGPLKAPWAYGIAAVAGGVMAIVSAFRMKQPK